MIHDLNHAPHTDGYSFFGEQELSIISDPGVDDLIALSLINKITGPGVNKQLISTYGNAPGEVTAINAQAFTEFAGDGWSHRSGAAAPYHGEFELGWQYDFHGKDGVWGERPPHKESNIPPQPTSDPESAISLAALTETYRLVGSGALKRLVVMGGVFDQPGNVNPYAECNIAQDPDAASLLFEKAGEVATSIVPLDVTRQVSWTFDDIQGIPTDTEENIWLKSLLTSWYANFLPGKEKLFKLHDPLAAYLAFYPEAAHWLRHGVAVITEGEQRGRTVLSSENQACDIAMGVEHPKDIAMEIYRILFGHADGS
ncbi:MAG TPA: nucleoside hydrolase [Patescibacteria group bacterium]|nr:nucleoside hydrolase [Patescibacteria group bacterium]